MKARVTVTLKNGVLDPQGLAIQGALTALGFAGVAGIRQGKIFDLDLDETDRASAERSLKSMCDKLLANTVIENYAIEIVESPPAAPATAPAISTTTAAPAADVSPVDDPTAD